MGNPELNRNWNQRYLEGDTPWAAHDLLTPVLELIEKLYPKGGSVLEIGCGYGQEAIALAKRGYDVTAVDLSDAAIIRAKNNAQTEGVNIHFHVFDLMHDQNKFAPFDVVFDISVMHTMDNAMTRQKFATAISQFLKPNAIWINFSCLNPDVAEVAEAENVKAPPALTMEEILQATKESFIVEEQQLGYYKILRDDKLVAFPAVISVLRKKV